MKRLVALALASAMTATFAQQPAVAKPAVAKPASSIPEQVKAIEESINNIAIPAWVDAQAQETFARFNAWKGDDVTVVFPVITDVHTSRRERNATELSLGKRSPIRDCSQNLFLTATAASAATLIRKE